MITTTKPPLIVRYRALILALLALLLIVDVLTLLTSIVAGDLLTSTVFALMTAAALYLRHTIKNYESED